MVKICYHNDERFRSFQECFQDCIVSKIDKLCEITVYYYVNTKDLVNSLSMTVTKYDNLYKISNITWKEEGIEYGYHDVCQSRCNEYALYDYDNHVIIQDVYLHDKYNDNADGYFSDRLETMFSYYPEVLPKYAD